MIIKRILKLIDCSLSLKIKNENYNLINCISKPDEKSEEFFIINKDDNKYLTIYEKHIQLSFYY